jgi:tetratricopeptide (TPR) repeat protein
MIEKQMFENPEELDAFVATHVVGRRVAHPAAITSMERAQDLVYQALESTGRLRVKRAREALKEWPDCAEALVLLAEEMPDAARRLDLYRQAVAAGERAFGPDAFHEHVGHFWAVLETRPYMRARLGLAESEWEAGHHEAAFEHWGEMLRLNPGDNQGVRYILLGRLLDQSRDGEARELLARFREEVSALFAYARALVEFRSLGDQAVSRAALATAIRRNPHVVKYLLGTASLPDELPSSYGWKSDEEAMIVADQFFRAWEATPGALDWLRTTRGELRDADKARRARRSGKR